MIIATIINETGDIFGFAIKNEVMSGLSASGGLKFVVCGILIGLTTSATPLSR